jgi:hypothetical protein
LVCGIERICVAEIVKGMNVDDGQGL